MSFSKDVKEELVKKVSNARHCRIAELAGMISLCGTTEEFYERQRLVIRTENSLVASHCEQLMNKVFHVSMQVEEPSAQNQEVWTLTFHEEQESKRCLQALKMKALSERSGLVPDKILYQNACCKRAFIRGSFLASGSVSNPERGYHFEVVMPDEHRAQQLMTIIKSFSVEAKVILRKKNYVVYVKEGSQIADLLNIMEAHVALMQFENVRILKEMRNSINRQVNCEAANITKTVLAARKQIDDIEYIRNTIGFSGLKDDLAATCELRLKYPDMPLKELGTMLSPPIGKSGMNHRLMKLSEIAEELRAK